MEMHLLLQDYVLERLLVDTTGLQKWIYNLD
jgi:hypothetical protein